MPRTASEDHVSVYLRISSSITLQRHNQTASNTQQLTGGFRTHQFVAFQHGLIRGRERHYGFFFTIMGDERQRLALFRHVDPLDGEQVVYSM